MATGKYSGEEIVQRGERLYQERIRSVVEAGNKGRYLVINIETEEYEMDDDDLTVSTRARARFPDAPLFAMRIGYPAICRLGSAAPRTTS